MQHQLFDDSLSVVFSVTECVETLNQHLNLLGEIIVEGEISRLEIKNRNLIFITIKDENSAIDVFGLTHQIRNITQLEDGMHVRVTGSPGLYKGSGKFRFMATSILPEGEGALQIAFEKLKKQLEKEGLFDESRKRPLPQWPQSIGLITAQDSSAYHDVVSTLNNRMGGLIIKHIPVSVQGREAVPTILKAFKYINHNPNLFDVIIMTRGGGSLEDLAAFNHEDLARAVYACKVPTISAIGHEDNWSLIDYIADVRASTPSNAAQITVSDKKQVIDTLNSEISHINRIFTSYIQYQFNQINSWIQLLEYNIDRQQDRINQIYQRIINIRSSKYIECETRHNLTNNLITQIKNSYESSLYAESGAHKQKMRFLYSLDIKKVLKRGFSISKDHNGKYIRSTSQLRLNQEISTIFEKGYITSTIKNIQH